MKEDIVPKLQREETDTHPALINPNTNLGKYKLWSDFNKVSLNFPVFTLFNCAGKGKKEKKKETISMRFPYYD